MQDDRIQMPQQVEKAFEYLKQAPTPTDFELNQQRARTWEQVVKRGQRFEKLNRWWKPAIGVLTTVAVVLLAVYVPQHLQRTKQAEIRNASAPSSSAKSPTQAYYDRQNQRIKLYQDQGKRYISSDDDLQADLVEVSDPKKNFNTLEVVKDGVPHEVYSFPRTQKAQATVLGEDLMGFQLMNVQTQFNDGNLYLINTALALQNVARTDAVKSFHYGNMPSMQQLRVLKRDGKLSLLYNVNSQTNRAEELLQKWDWDSGKTETLYRTTNQFLEGMTVFQKSIVLNYQKQAILLTDQGGKLIDQSEQGIHIMQYSTDGGDMVYSKGAITATAYGSYHGDVQIKSYDVSQAEPVPLLPGVTGDQLLVGAPPDNQYLIENFIADDPVQARSTAVTQVAGTLQFWYVKRGAQPKLVYSQKRTSEEFFISVNMLDSLLSYPYPDPMNGILLLTPMYNKESKTGLSFNWKTHAVEEIVDPANAKQNASGH